MIHNTISQNIIRYDNTCLTFNDIEHWKYLWYFKNMIWNDRDDYSVAHNFNMLADHNLHKQSILMENYNNTVGSAIVYIR